MAGAVDLAAVQARNEAAARAAETPPPAAGEYVVQITEATFQTEVLDRSFQVPVLIAVTSARAPGGDQLTALLERLAGEAAGAWVLAVIDLDENPRIVQALQVRAVPTVYAVIGGQLVPGFEGALPEDQLRGFLEAVAQAGREAGLSAVPPADANEVPEEPDDPRFTAAEDALEQGDYATAAQRYQQILDVEPNNTQAALALQQVRMLERVESVDPALAAGADSNPDDVDAQLAAADMAMAANDADAAFRRLIDLIGRTAGDERDRVRERLIEYFDLLGSDDPRVAPARREMARVLF
ncbi:MAG TPA: tetratricopeptide repeat protein [Jatrophihabitantaceae bacterium]|nr:tetratricopeptide repeat protein [Jatrophihabitantaceae bacterium]